MEDLQQPLDLDLWLNRDLIRRQNFLKNQFISILEEVANAFPAREFQDLSQRPRGSKVSKGNDLLGLPYQVLDLIRDFDSLDGVNIRLLNWFGRGFYLTLLLGKERKNPVQPLLEEGFSFGLSENKWDYPDLILNGNQTRDAAAIRKNDTGFHLWIKALPIDANPQTNASTLRVEVKKILGILRLPGEQSRN
ncbi:hypothetical protein J0A68_17075 [Algoriphagus sp. H41]|uniref:Uncharacterized protein n=1 Tax=Algoriphagus oliviformis TaxID=2811231 RepID=A0ABS3C926_9BACT|nr:hypothetical protein [Algoriphagus oliviformis]MBN7812671.1 hypothetical protein [Algoriphagus oliviformis]